MSVRRACHSARAPQSGVAGTLQGPAIDLKPEYQTTVTGMLAEGMAKLSVEAAPAMTQKLLHKYIMLESFCDAFDPPVKEIEKGEEKTRFPIKAFHTGSEARAAVMKIQKWVKVGGKNNMAPRDVQALLNIPWPYTFAYNAAENAFPGERVGIVFDGDNYEPHSAPFSKLIADLISEDFLVVAVKDQAKVSGGFHNGWIELARKHPNFLMAVVNNKEELSENADAFVYLGSTYKSEASGFDYRYKPNEQPTQGYSEIKAKEDNPELYRVTEIRNGLVRIFKKRAP